MTEWIQVSLGIFTLLLAVGGLIREGRRRRDGVKAAIDQRAQDLREADDQRRRDLADKVIAWTVSEGDEAGSNSTGQYGVVLVNGSGMAALNVCLKTRREVVESDGSRNVVAVPSGVPGTRFALVPPGTYYTRYEPDAVAERWTSLLPVDTASGYFSTKIQDDDNTSTTVPLMPRSLSPSPSRVVLLRFEVADRTWWRDRSMTLQGPAKSGQSVGSNEAWEREFEDAGRRSRKPARGRRDASVQAVVRQLFAELTGTEASHDGASEATVRDHFVQQARVRVPRSQQTVLVDLLDGHGDPIDVTYRLQGRGTPTPTIGSMWIYHPPGSGPADGIRVKSTAASLLSRSPDDLQTPEQITDYAGMLMTSIVEHHRSQIA